MYVGWPTSRREGEGPLACAGSSGRSTSCGELWLIEAWITGGAIIVMLAALVHGRIGADLCVLGTVGALLAADTLLGLDLLKPGEALSGFSSQGLATVALLYVVAAGVKETGAISWITQRMLGNPTTALQAQSRLIFPVAVASAFVNNTPIVAMFLPVLSGLAKRTGIPVGQLFMPLSFAAILGGLCTLIGTSTNLVVHGLIQEENRIIREAHLAAGGDAANVPGLLPDFGMFTLAWVGVPMAITGVVYMLLLGRKLLPGRRAGDEQASDREYMTAMRVVAGSALVGKTIAQAELRHLPGLFLSRIDRPDQTVVAVSPEEVLEADDVLVFVGQLDSVIDLQKIKGLLPATDEEESAAYRPSMRLIEAVVSERSPLLNLTVRDAQIRSRYGAVVVAVHRQGHQLRGRLGDVRLRPGDTLLLEASSDFAKRYKGSTDFYLVSDLDETAAPRHERAWVAMAILGGLVVALTLMPKAPAVPALAAALGMVLLRCCTGPQARRSVDWSVLLVIGGAFAIGHAMTNSGLAAVIAHWGVGWAQPLGLTAMLGVVYLLTVVFTAMINNNAAAVLMFPVALEVSQHADQPFMPFAVCVCLAASAEFSTPIGYQTNLIVMGPGHYKWLDYTRFGGPLTILVGIVAVLLIPLFYAA